MRLYSVFIKQCSSLYDKVLRAYVLLGLVLVSTSCATYYQSNYQFNKKFESGDFKGALEALKDIKRGSKNRFLYFVNNGLIHAMLAEYEESNQYFEKAFLFWEDFKVDYFSEVGSYLLNPTITVYRGEDHEHLLLLYYKALNFLKMNKTQEALVECRRLNIRLQQLSDRYRSDKKYKQDAFIHNLMGIIYDADRDYNNAFIAYRNAFLIYQNQYESMFQVQTPQQLKMDLLRTAKLSGLETELAYYKKKFNLPDYQYKSTEGGELIFFWHNGLSPIKTEWGIRFMIKQVDNSDLIVFNNETTGLTYSFPKLSFSDKNLHELQQLKFVSFVLPKYVQRPVYYDQSFIETKGVRYSLELAEDINKIAFKVLEERMGYELAHSLIRTALKQSSEYALGKENKNLRMLLNVVNTVTEKADTRNWQTLPHSISYTRIPLPVGETKLVLHLNTSDQQRDQKNFTFNVTKGQVIYHTFTSLETKFGN